MTIQLGDTLPNLPLQRVGEGIEKVDSATLFAGKRVLLFAVPGAFTPTCSKQHLPGYIAALEHFRQQGIEVMCLAVNDAYVMQAWATSQQVPPGLAMLADGNAEFTRALGLERDGSAYGMGWRARRFAIYAEDGVVKQLQVEAPGEFRVTGAEPMLALLGLPPAPAASAPPPCGCG
jgi:peroxiredoxin